MFNTLETQKWEKKTANDVIELVQLFSA